ncbi:AAA-ATPase At4g30250-like [Phalaenopsis equestris]|uniref:AAA-ATPase At4g30250-like n=1 Tax=Phalaenopsis equestris TaxID=78828 RepID=UPI0009E63E4B|nr:AAA-ATPase At4g30250-like [Phalaenopsis equestris]
MELLSQMWSLLGLLTVLQNILPAQLLSLLHSLWESLQDAITPYSYFDIPEFLGSSAINPNDLYRHVHLYLFHHLLLHPPSPPPRLTLSSSSPSSPPSFSLSPNHSLHDTFAGHRLLWTHHSDSLHDSLEERRFFSLRLPKRHSHAILLPYLSHLSSSARNLTITSRDRRIFTNSSPNSWSSVPFRHPATFQTLALNPNLRSFLLSDLDSFAAGREFYTRVGRPWKRGYFLHGPPGSGKSSLIAAMANHLQYDVYDLELTRVPHNSALKSLLLQTTPRSIIVIEDIDCSLQLAGERCSKKRKADDDDEGWERVTLSGLLNFTDGLWSCCGEEKLIVFTTNYKGEVDKALLRPGRMDVHVQLGACGGHEMREMVERYVGGDWEEMMEVAERWMRNGAVMTAAEVGEVLLRNKGDGEVAVKELVGELEGRINGGCSEELEEEWVGEEGEEEVMVGREKRRRGRNGCAVREASCMWEKRVRFLTRLGSFTKSESGRRGV